MACRGSLFGYKLDNGTRAVSTVLAARLRFREFYFCENFISMHFPTVMTNIICIFIIEKLVNHRTKNENLEKQEKQECKVKKLKKVRRNENENRLNISMIDNVND